MTKQAVQALPTRELWAVVRSTSTAGNYWQALVWAKDELARRHAARGVRLIGL